MPPTVGRTAAVPSLRSTASMPEIQCGRGNVKGHDRDEATKIEGPRGYEYPQPQPVGNPLDDGAWMVNLVY
jgi:hypothetical protein